jgi:hypothetical protein
VSARSVSRFTGYGPSSSSMRPLACMVFIVKELTWIDGGRKTSNSTTKH